MDAETLLAELKPVVVAVLEAEPGWVWAQCPICVETRYQRRAAKYGRCRMTPRCPGELAVYIEPLCVACGRPVTARRRRADIRFCSKKCEGVR
jgi:hypothetical protein